MFPPKPCPGGAADISPRCNLGVVEERRETFPAPFQGARMGMPATGGALR
jgi:hypothetical protein